MKKIRILIANPAGNITIFVLDHFEPRQYQSIASQLLAMTELKGEQVAFVADENTMHMWHGILWKRFQSLRSDDRAKTGHCRIRPGGDQRQRL